MATVKDGAKFVESWRWDSVVPESWCQHCGETENHKEAESLVCCLSERKETDVRRHHKGRSGKRSAVTIFQFPKAGLHSALSFHENPFY